MSELVPGQEIQDDNSITYNKGILKDQQVVLTIAVPNTKYWASVLAQVTAIGYLTDVTIPGTAMSVTINDSTSQAANVVMDNIIAIAQSAVDNFVSGGTPENITEDAISGNWIIASTRDFGRGIVQYSVNVIDENAAGVVAKLIELHTAMDSEVPEEAIFGIHRTAIGIRITLITDDVDFKFEALKSAVANTL